MSGAGLTGTPSSAQTTALVAASRARPSQIAAVNYNLRFYPLSLQARALVLGVWGVIAILVHRVLVPRIAGHDEVIDRRGHTHHRTSPPLPHALEVSLGDQLQDGEAHAAEFPRQAEVDHAVGQVLDQAGALGEQADFRKGREVRVRRPVGALPGASALPWPGRLPRRSCRARTSAARAEKD